MSRRTAREQVFKLIYERCESGEENDFSLELALNGSSDEDAVYIAKVYRGVNENYDFIKNSVIRFSNGFDFERIYKVDCALIMLAAYEIFFLEDIPVKVSVNEALELAKIYSTAKSVSFINGILASLIENKESLLNERNN